MLEKMDKGLYCGTVLDFQLRVFITVGIGPGSSYQTICRLQSAVAKRRIGYITSSPFCSDG